MQRRLGLGKRSIGILMSLLLLYGLCLSESAHAGRTNRYVGVLNCYICHSDDNYYTGTWNVFGDSDKNKAKAIGWLNGPHGNMERTYGVDIGSKYIGFPSYGFGGFSTDPTCSRRCHDPQNGGKKINLLFKTTGVPVLGDRARPVVGCESCHGKGGTHWGDAPMPFPRPGPTRCKLCHDKRFRADHLTYHPEGKRVYEDYRASVHSKRINEHTYRGKRVIASCARCHTDEGARKYIRRVNGLATYDEILAAMAGKPDIANASVVQCRTCHDPHQPLRLLGEESRGLPSTWSDEFKTCISCHQLLKADDTLLTDGYHDPSVNPYGSAEDIITDTHYDDPLTTDIEGYVVDPASTHDGLAKNMNSGTCRDCHNPHRAGTAINRQWAHSAHGGHIAQVKEENPANPVTEEDGPAWVHYNFKGSDRAACQKCHTSTGFRNFANDPSTYNPVNNVFVATGEQREMLYCWACHTTNKEGIRDPGIFALTSEYTVPADRIAAVPDQKGSNTCLVCHNARKNGQMIKDKSFPGDIVGKNYATFGPHYLTAAGTIFRTTGYEFDGRDYANSYFKHDLTGSAAAPGTGTNGSCVGCHMLTAEGHLFLPVKEDADGKIIEITAMAESCGTCHAEGSGLAITAEDMQELREGFEAALDALNVQLAAKGIYRGSGYPYYFATSVPANQSMGTAFKNWPDKNTLGAAYNHDLFTAEAGAYTHNQLYARRLLFDSIDWLDDGVMNSSVGATLGSGPAYDYLHDARS